MDKPRPYGKNPRVIPPEAIDAVALSIKEYGFRQPIVVDEDDVIIVGHTRLLAAKKLGMTTVPVHVAVGLTKAQAKAYRLADNKASTFSSFDKALIHDELEALRNMDFDLAKTLFGVDEISAMSDDGGGLCDPDAVPEVPKEAISKPGDLWILGNHRLLVGDSREEWAVVKLMDGAKAAVAFTSPPYASQREYDPTSGFMPIKPDDYVEWWIAVQANVAEHLAEDGSFFVNIKEACDDGQRQLYVKDLVLAHVRQWGWRFIDEFCWTHGGTPKAPVNRFKNGWEPVFQFVRGAEFKFRPQAVMHESDAAIDIYDGANVSKNRGEKYRGELGFKKNGQVGKSGHPNDQNKQGKKFRGPKGNSEGMGGMGGMGDAVGARAAGAVGAGWAYPSNVLSVGKNREALGHSAAFPVALPEFFINAYSDKDDIIYEPFGGSGSTMIACEATGRRCYQMEISPLYADIICNRFEKFTGRKAVLEAR